MNGYKSQFDKAGEILVRLNAIDLIDWINTSSRSEMASVEAFLIGECEDPEESIQAIRRKLDAPVIAMLEMRSLEQLTMFYHLGVDDVVVKPVHFEELLMRIAAIKKRTVPPSRPATDKPIVVYFDGRDPELTGKQLALPRRERRILEYLASINGRRATKAQIFGAIYGLFDEHIEENVIESHISKLRKKLREKLGFDPIDSRRYLGYRLDQKFVATEKPGQPRLVA